MRLPRLAFSAPLGLVAAGLLAVILSFVVVRPSAAVRMEFFEVRTGSVTIRSEPDGHSEPRAELAEGTRFHLTLKRRGGFTEVVVNPDLSGWLSDGDRRDRTSRCPNP